jgi:hypothetical protein
MYANKLKSPYLTCDFLCLLVFKYYLKTFLLMLPWLRDGNSAVFKYANLLLLEEPWAIFTSRNSG